MKPVYQNIHFLGIAGIGMSALAQVVLARGAQVSGSDPHADPETNPAIGRLLAGGAKIFSRHAEENLTSDIDLVVVSAAVPEDNPEIQAARARGVRIVSRAEFLGTLMAAHRGVKIAVAGTHGKTTTTAMIGVMLQQAGLNPTVFVGGEVAQLGGNVRIGSPTGPFVAEACEAYGSFLYLKPDLAVVTNIEADHLDHYGDYTHLLQSFRQFLSNVPTRDSVGRSGIVLCADDLNCNSLVQSLDGRQNLFPYGIESSRVNSGAISVDVGRTTTFTWYGSLSGSSQLATITLHVPGLHNVYNALAAAAVGSMLGLDGNRIADGLAEFRGASRRQEILDDVPIQGGSVLVVDDYAHHPTEIRATLDALRAAWPERRLVAVFQPHLYSRTRDFLTEFAAALAEADALLVTDIYAAREAPIANVRSAAIVNLAVQANRNLPAIYLPQKDEIPRRLRALVKPDDLVVFLGAGDIREQAERFASQLREEASR